MAENGRTTPITLDTIKMGTWHVITALSIFFAAMPDGLNDNFVVFTHDDIQFNCSNIQESMQPLVKNQCPEDTDTPCDPFFFDRIDMSMNQTTYVSEFSLVCEHRHYANLATSLMFFGVLCTSPFNYVSDLYGRKRVMLVSCLGQAIAILAASMSAWHWLYAGSLYLNGFFGGLKYKAAAVLIAESVTTDYRDNAGTLLMVGFCAGYALLAPMAYLFPHWRTLTHYISGISFAAAALIQLLVLESTVWLVQKKRYGQAEANVRKLAKAEQHQAIMESLQESRVDETDNGKGDDGMLENLRLLVVKKVLQYRLAVMGYVWFATSVLFRSFALGTSDLEGSPYWNCVYSAAFDALACFISLALLKVIGRRSGITLCFFACAVCTLACAFCSPRGIDRPDLVRIFAMISKLGFLGTHNINYIYTPELFPLVVRSTAMGAVGILDGLGAVIAPFFLDYRKTNQEMQYIIQTVTAAVAGALCLFTLPETSQFKLPVTDEDLEEAEQTRIFFRPKRQQQQHRHDGVSYAAAATSEM